MSEPQRASAVPREYGRINGTTGTGELPYVSVVIPARNAASTIGDQLRALSNQTFSDDFEIVVAGNRCTDDTQTVVQAFEDLIPRLTYVPADERVGVSYARNVGVACANGDLLLFCDADDVVDQGWVEGMVAALAGADVVGGALEPRGSYAAWALRASFAPVTALPVARGMAYAVGASVAYRREVHEAIGGWDERFVNGADDLVLSLRAQQAGFRLGFAPEAVCRYTLRTKVRDAARQQRCYGRGEALLTTLYRRDLDRGLATDLGALGRRSLRLAAKARSLDDVNAGYLAVSYDAARMVAMARLRRGGARESARGHLLARLTRMLPPKLGLRVPRDAIVDEPSDR